MWIEVIVWYKQKEETELERLGLASKEDEDDKYNPEKEGIMFINTDHIIRVNPSEEKNISIIWVLEDSEFNVCYHVKHSMGDLRKVLQPIKINGEKVKEAAR